MASSGLARDAFLETGRIRWLRRWLVPVTLVVAPGRDPWFEIGLWHGPPPEAGDTPGLNPGEYVFVPVWVVVA